MEGPQMSYTVLEQGTDISGPVSIHSQLLPRLHPPQHNPRSTGQPWQQLLLMKTEALLFYSVCDKTLPGKVVRHISDRLTASGISFSRYHLNKRIVWKKYYVITMCDLTMDDRATFFGKIQPDSFEIAIKILSKSSTVCKQQSRSFPFKVLWWSTLSLWMKLILRIAT